MTFEGTIIKQIPLIQEDIEDQLMWPHAKDGNYSVKTGYNYLKKRLDAASPSSANNNNSDKMWKRL
jgi:hypothetical protein